MNQEVENHIRNNTTWPKLPNNIRQYNLKIKLIGNSQKEYEKAIVNYCIKNQARFKDTLVRNIRKDEKKYYEELLKYSKENYMLYPYHLSDIFVRGLRITPFNYYLDMIADLMSLEKSYDTLPNFTAIDCLRLLGIGRNQYIDIINKYRSSSNNRLRTIGLGGKRKPVRTLLPTQPISILIEPWWLVSVGCVTDDDVKLLSTEEKTIIDRLIDNQNPTVAGLLINSCVHSLYKKGLIYLDVPLVESDRVELPPLEGFVMNRITGDYFETLLYKLFVSIDERITLGELAALLQIDIDLVINAVSVYCRLAFTKKKSTNPLNVNYDPTWNDLTTVGNVSINTTTAMTDTSPEIADIFGDMEKTKLMSHFNSSSESNSAKRIGFLFDSTLTAFLMMGNLSLGLKNHAVTMFEVGRLNDQMLDSFLGELDKVEEDKLGNEGEAQRYFDHAIILKSTIKFLRYNPELTVFSGYFSGGAKTPKCEPLASLVDINETKEEGDLNEQEYPNEQEPMGVDLLRCESLASLDDESRQRVLAKNYSILFSMAPYNSSGDALNSPPITSDAPFHMGPAIPEMNSPWFKFYLYALISNGPPSILIPKGYRLTNLPDRFKYYEKFMILTWGHDPIISSHSNLLITLNDVSCHGAILVHCYSECDNNQVEIVHVAFNDTENPLYNHPSVIKLHKLLNLEYFSGYISLIKRYISNSNSDSIDFDDWIFLDLRFGIPLFDKALNSRILNLFKKNKQGSLANLNRMLETNRRLTLKLINFIQVYQAINIIDHPTSKTSSETDDEYLIRKLLILNTNIKKSSSNMVIYPTQCVLYQDGKTQIYQDEGYFI